MKNYLPPHDLLANRVILVTGASSGLGRAASLAFARHGATVALLARNEAKLEAVYDEIVAAGYPEPAMFTFDLAAADGRGLETLAGTIAHHCVPAAAQTGAACFGRFHRRDPRAPAQRVLGRLCRGEIRPGNPHPHMGRRTQRGGEPAHQHPDSRAGGDYPALAHPSRAFA